MEDKNNEWSNGIIDNQHEALVGTRLISSTADNVALSTKVVSEYDNVIVTFYEEVYRIEKCGLDSKQKSDIIDDPDDSVFTVDDDEDDDDDDDVDIDDDDDDVDIDVDDDDDDDDEILHYKSNMYRVKDNAKVPVGTITPFQLEADDIELTDVLENDIPSYVSWNKVQGVPLKTYTNGLYGVFCAKDLKESYKDLIDEFLLRLGSHLGVKDVDNIQHFFTFLSSQRDKKSKKFQECIQKYHRDFQPNELATANNKWYIVFIPMKKSGM